MDPLQNDAALICAYLLRRGYLRKKSFPQLELDEHLLRNVQDRLAEVGMELVINTYSQFYAVRLRQQAQDTIEEESNNLGLKNNEVAMLVILWSKLILPKRVVYEPGVDKTIIPGGNGNPAGGNGNLVGEQTRDTQEEDVPTVEDDIPAVEASLPPDRIFVKVGELHAEFGKHFGSKQSFKSALTRLSKLNFVHIHNEVITEGILLDLLIDGYQMGNEIKRSALSYKLAGLMDEEEMYELDDEESDEEQDTFEFKEDLTDEVEIKEIGQIDPPPKKES